MLRDRGGFGEFLKPQTLGVCVSLQSNLTSPTRY